MDTGIGIEIRCNGLDCDKNKVRNGRMVERGGLWDMHGMGRFTVLYHSGVMGAVYDRLDGRTVKAPE